MMGTAFHCTWMAKVGVHTFVYWFELSTRSWGEPWYWKMRSQSCRCCTAFTDRELILNPERWRA